MSAFDQADDFRAECDSLAEVLEPLHDEAFETETLFKRWTLHDVIAHLHLFNWAADASIHDPGGFRTFWAAMGKERQAGTTMLEYQDHWLEGKRNRSAYEAWRDYYPGMCDRLDGIDPKMRVEWAGPSMSVS